MVSRFTRFLNRKSGALERVIPAKTARYRLLPSDHALWHGQISIVTGRIIGVRPVSLYRNDLSLFLTAFLTIV